VRGATAALARYRRFLDGTGIAAGVLVFFICIGISADVLLRWVGSGGIAWMNEAIEYLQYAMVLIGAAWVLQLGAHIAIDAFVAILPSGTRRVLGIVANAIGFAACAAFTAAASAATFDTWARGILVHKSFTLPAWLPIALLALAFALLTLGFLLRLLGIERRVEKVEL
jgi:C4-dicarboxylate transporter DctQ subunit